MTKVSRLKKPKGITIIESLIAVFLIAITVATTLFALAATQRFIALARHHYRAASFAREATERVIAGLNPQAGPRVLDPGSNLTGNLVDNSTATIVEITVTWNETIMAAVDPIREETIIYVR